MSTSNNRNCVVCSKSYKLCRTCEDAKAKGLFRWRSSCDTPQCFQVLMVINDFYYEKISKEDARNLLDGILTEEMKPYDENARTLIEKIYELEETNAIVKMEEFVEEKDVIDISIEDRCIAVETDNQVEQSILHDSIAIEEVQLESDTYEYQQEYEDDSQGDTSHC